MKYSPARKQALFSYFFKILLESLYSNAYPLYFQAALLASGASVIGVASDIAGSIRLPSAFSGVFGHKPTPGKQLK